MNRTGSYYYPTGSVLLESLTYANCKVISFQTRPIMQSTLSLLMSL